jgi:hypothetical protein
VFIEDPLTSSMASFNLTTVTTAPEEGVAFVFGS